VLDHIVVIAQASRITSRRCFITCPRPATRSGFQAAQPGWARDSPRPVSRQDAAADIHLHALPVAEFLPAGHAQLCSHQSAVGGEPGALRENTSPVSASIRSTIRRRGCALMARSTSAATRKRVCALGFCRAHEAGAAGDGEVFRCGHHAWPRRHDYAHAFDNTHRMRTARWRSFIPAMSGRRTRWWRT
jgi:hypothetical protein